jgi:integrase
MRYTIHDRVVLARAPEGPLAAHIVAFANSIAAQGYSTQSLRYHVRLAAGLSRWLGRNGIDLHKVCPDHGAQYLRYRARHVRPAPGDRAALRHLIDFLDRERLISAQRTPTRRLTPIESCTQAYVEYLHEARALSKATIINYMPFIREFLEDCFGDGRVRLSRLRAGDVVSFVQCQAPRLHLKRAKLMTTALRSFLRYACYRGDITLDLAAAVPVVANWSMPSIPRGIPPEQIQQLLVSIDRRTAVGRRDCAGINAPTTGAHQFRHALASQMLRQGASLSEIGELLGHHHPQTTKIYTKVDIKALRTLAVPWPGGAR